MIHKLVRLFGGHRNQVFRIDGKVKIVWRDGYARREQIREGVLLENFVATHTDVKARMLVDKARPIQEEDGKLVTYFHYVNGEIRYPWNLEEIESAARLLTRLHQKVGLRALPKVRPSGTGRSDLLRQLHLDFARGNVLFRQGTSDAIGVIDFENTALGPVEQELGRTMSFLLVDTPIKSGKRNVFDPEGPEWAESEKLIKEKFQERINAFLIHYGLPYHRDDAFRWVTRYLKDEDYGNLNPVRDKSVEFLLHSSPVS